MLSVHGVRGRQPVVGDTIGWWWDSFKPPTPVYGGESSILEMLRWQRKQAYSLQLYYDMINKRNKLVTVLLYTLALAEGE